MSDSPDSSDDDTGQNLPAPPEEEESELDDNGFDPADFRWVPVLRKPRADGWSPQRQKTFLLALADTGVVEMAAEIAGMSVSACYKLRRSPGAESFSECWDLAIRYAIKRVQDVAFERGIRGVEEPIFNKDGQRIGSKRRYSDRMLMFLLRAHMPETYRYAHQNLLHAHENLPPGPEPFEQALQKLEPVPPPDPHLLMPPDDLDSALSVAESMDGELPSWHRDKSMIHGDTGPSPLGPGFEEKVDAAKRAATPPHLRADPEEE
jgi:hypothetical protein